MTDAIVKYEKKLEMPVQDMGSMRTLLEANQQRLIELIPETSGVSLNMIFSSALEAAMDNRGILRCSGMSIIRSVKKSAELGLSLSKLLRHAHLVPYKGECTLQIGYGGWEDLVYRATIVKMLDCEVIYRGDEYQIEKGSHPNIKHIINPSASHDIEEIVLVYAQAFFGDNIPPRIEWMPLSEVKKIRAESKNSGGGPWVKWFGEMAKKCPVIRLCKHLPKSRESKLMEIALAHEYQMNSRGMMHLIADPAQKKAEWEAMKAEIGGGKAEEVTTSAPETTTAPIPAVTTVTGPDEVNLPDQNPFPPEEEKKW